MGVLLFKGSLYIKYLQLVIYPYKAIFSIKIPEESLFRGNPVEGLQVFARGKTFHRLPIGNIFKGFPKRDNLLNVSFREVFKRENIL